MCFTLSKAVCVCVQYSYCEIVREKHVAYLNRMLEVRTLVVLYLWLLIVIYLFISNGNYSDLNNQLLLIKKRAYCKKGVVHL